MSLLQQISFDKETKQLKQFCTLGKTVTMTEFLENSLSGIGLGFLVLSFSIGLQNAAELDVV